MFPLSFFQCSDSFQHRDVARSADDTMFVIRVSPPEHSYPYLQMHLLMRNQIFPFTLIVLSPPSYFFSLSYLR